MRDALNNNPMVQICVIGVLIVFAGFFLFTRMKGSDSSGGGGSTSTTAAATAGTAPGAVSGDSAATAPGVSSASASASSAAAPPVSAGTVSPEALVPGPGLPKNVIASWHKGDGVVLLIVRNGGIDDNLVEASVHSLSQPGVKVFVVKAGEIARYSRITQGVGVNRVPALVVVRPRSGGESVPQAQVSYGFRNAQSVVQAVHDALYKGPDDLPYDPG